MDWTTPLRSQQSDFIKRVKSGYLLHCEIEGRHSELTVISGERLEQLREFCWEMAEKYKRNSPVRKVFIGNMKGKLGEEVVKARLGKLVNEVDYEKKLRGDGKVDFTMASDRDVAIQVKARHGNIDTVQWTISQEEVEKNTALICILIQEEVKEAQPAYNLIMAGFLPTESIEIINGKALVGIDKLLYSGGLQSYLESLQIVNSTAYSQEDQQSSTQKLPLESSPTITIGSWKCTLPIEELVSLEAAIKELREKQIIEIMWQEVLAHLYPLATQALLRQHSNLLAFDGQVACISMSSQPMCELAQKKLPHIEAAFEAVLHSKIEVRLVSCG